jgi:hypothetical protein
MGKKGKGKGKAAKKDKCCKKYKDGKACSRCPKT